MMALRFNWLGTRMCLFKTTNLLSTFTAIAEVKVFYCVICWANAAYLLQNCMFLFTFLGWYCYPLIKLYQIWAQNALPVPDVPDWNWQPSCPQPCSTLVTQQLPVGLKEHWSRHDVTSSAPEGNKCLWSWVYEPNAAVSLLITLKHCEPPLLAAYNTNTVSSQNHQLIQPCICTFSINLVID